MLTVAANIEKLITWNRSMAVALERAEKGSGAEDAYFIEKLIKSVRVLGYEVDISAGAVTSAISEKLT